MIVRILQLCLCVSLALSAKAATLDVESLRGQVVYLDFWASWCAPCRQSFPWMQKMADTYGSQGLTVVAVDLDVNRAPADRFLAQLRPTFEIRFDPKGELPELYEVKGMPASVVIDRHGKRRYSHIGFLPGDAARYEAELRELLAEK